MTATARRVNSAWRTSRLGRAAAAVVVALLLAAPAPAVGRQTEAGIPPAAAGVETDLAPLSPEEAATIRFLEARVAAHPEDAALATRLGAAWLEHAGRTHDYRAYARAESALKRALVGDGRHVPALVLLGSCHLGQHRFRDALDAAGRALEVDPKAFDAVGLRGDALLQLGELSRARADYQALLDARPGLLAHARMAHLQFAEGDATAAAASLVAALRVGGEAAEPAERLAWGLVRLGELRFRTGDWADAARCYRTARELRPDDADVLDHLAELHAARAEYAEALALSARAIALSPRPEFHQSRGDVYAATGDVAEARRWHERALAGYLEAARAGHAHYYHHLAGLYCDAEAVRDPVEALHWAEKDVAIRRTVATLDARAWALYHARRHADAAKAMDEALLQPTAEAHVLYHASLIYARAGDSGKGRDCLRRAAAANPKFNAFHFHR